MKCEVEGHESGQMQGAMQVDVGAKDKLQEGLLTNEEKTQLI